MATGVPSNPPEGMLDCDDAYSDPAPNARASATGSNHEEPDLIMLFLLSFRGQLAGRAERRNIIFVYRNSLLHKTETVQCLSAS